MNFTGLRQKQLDERQVAAVAASYVPLDTSGSSAAVANTALIQSALSAGGSFAVAAAGTAYLSAALLLGSDTSITIPSGVTLIGSATRQHNFARTGNAEYLSNGIPGIYILCATQATEYGEGGLTYTHSGTTLTYTAPGDTAGTPVDISAVSSVATSRIFTVPSGTATKQLHVVVNFHASRNANSPHTLRVEPVTGAQAITFVRNGTTLVATEAGHKRRVGDLVMVFGTTPRHGYITAATADSWTIADTTAAASGSAQAYGTRNVSIQAFGAALIGNHAAAPNTNIANDSHAMVMFATNGLRMTLGRLVDFTKYVVYVTGAADAQLNGVRSPSGDCADTAHFTGPQRVAQVFGVRAKASDNIVGLGCCDYIDYNIFFPTAGTVDVEDVTVDTVVGTATIYEPVRIYNANSGWMRRIKVRKVLGTYDTATASAAVRVISDVNASQVDAGATNIDGLEIEEVTASADDASVHTPAIIMTGTGTRRGISIKGVPGRPCGSNTNGTIVIDSALEDLTVEPMDGAGGFSGGYLHLRGSATVKHLTINLPKRMRGNCSLAPLANTGTAQQPAILQLEAAAATVTNLVVNNPSVEDINVTSYTFTVSGVTTRPAIADTYTNNGQTFTVAAVHGAANKIHCTGTGAPAASGTLTRATGAGDATITFASVATNNSKATMVRNVGVIGAATLNAVRGVNLESVWKQLTGSNASTRLMVNGFDLDSNCTYFVTTDVAIAAIRVANGSHAGNTFAQIGAAGTYAWEAVNCNFAGIFVRNAAGAGTHTIRASNVFAGTFLRTASTPTISLAAVGCSATTPITVDSGTPDIRLLGGGCSLPLDGAVLNATATNHAAGAGFYNTSAAAFGSVGVGALVRGASAFVRVAA